MKANIFLASQLLPFLLVYIKERDKNIAQVFSYHLATKTYEQGEWQKETRLMMIILEIAGRESNDNN